MVVMKTTQICTHKSEKEQYPSRKQTEGRHSTKAHRIGEHNHAHKIMTQQFATADINSPMDEVLNEGVLTVQFESVQRCIDTSPGGRSSGCCPKMG